jgi:hypothetical protein
MKGGNEKIMFKYINERRVEMYERTNDAGGD